jgi:uncharacterized protein (DUF433 family)
VPVFQASPVRSWAAPGSQEKKNRSEKSHVQVRWEHHEEKSTMKHLTRITLDPAIMGGRACIRGMRMTVATIVGLLAAKRTREEILKAYPYLEPEDIDEALAYAAWLLEEREGSLPVP